MKNMKLVVMTTVASAAISTAAMARDTVALAGSSTVAPFAEIVVERFNQSTEFNAEYNSTGTGGGFQLFCGGVGAEYTDYSGASRQIRDSELELCETNGVTDVYELIIGYDGIVLANQQGGPEMNINRGDLFAALAKQVEVDGEIVDNPYTMWNEINPELPAIEIEVLGPPPTSGTRDAFVELVMEEGCQDWPAIAALEESDEDLFENVCATMREDGVFVEAGEDDNLIVQRLGANENAFGIFGFSFLDQNLDVLQGAQVDGLYPTFDNIASGEYPVSRSLYLYVKTQHIGVIPGMLEFIQEMTSEGTFGEEGYLVDAGLIPLTEQERDQVRVDLENLQ